ncbi:unnamed protein product [Pedinophyceae sp. YPF-701]|nr:unnamed protein product [Pedinophyceae sp. YPF-701]
MSRRGLPKLAPEGALLRGDARPLLAAALSDSLGPLRHRAHVSEREGAPTKVARPSLPHDSSTWSPSSATVHLSALSNAVCEDCVAPAIASLHGGPSRAWVASSTAATRQWSLAAAEPASVRLLRIASSPRNTERKELDPASPSTTALPNLANSSNACQADTLKVADAAACDSAMEDLDERAKRYEMFARETPLHKKLKSGAKQAARAAVAMARNLPSKLAALRAMTSEDWAEWRRGAWQATKEVAHHYWVGTKLLWTDVRIALRLTSKVLSGKQLSRRERRQLTRTTADVVRLVPMMAFVIIPFMELLLPVALKLFPNMLPSQYEDKLKREEEMRKQLKARMQVAAFLQDTLVELAKDLEQSRDGATAESASDLIEFVSRVRAGERVTNEEIMRFAPIFNDELTLDNLDRLHLINMCRFVGIAPYGSDAFLRARLRQHIISLKRDDIAISREGLDALTEGELREAARARGMRAPFGPHARPYLIRDLQDWLDLSLNRSVPSSLLILSRAVTLSRPGAPRATTDTGEVLRDALGAIPDDAVEEIEAASARLGVEVTDLAARTQAMERKIEALRMEEEALREDEAEEADRRASLEHARASAAASGEGASDGATRGPEEVAAAATARAILESAATAVVQKELTASGVSPEEVQYEELAERERKLKEVVSALSTLATGTLEEERSKFVELVRKEMDIIQETTPGDAGVLEFTGGSLKSSTVVLKDLQSGALAAKLNKMLSSIERDIDRVESLSGEAFKIVQMGPDGVVPQDELVRALSFLRSRLGEDETRVLLERLAGEDGVNVDVKKLMSLAQETEFADSMLRPPSNAP